MATQSRNAWTEDELAACVDAYVEMLAKELRYEPFIKARINDQLRQSALSGRSRGSIEYRMQNISYVMQTLGLPWITGYKPAANIGGHAKVIQRLIEHHDLSFAESHASSTDPLVVRRRSRRIRRRGHVDPPVGQQSPAAVAATTTRYERSTHVVAYVLQTAAGRCEACHVPGPFQSEGEPFLEVHHVVPLSDGGPDTVDNAVAVCPNCHRALHLADDKDERTKELVERVMRLAPS